MYRLRRVLAWWQDFNLQLGKRNLDRRSTRFWLKSPSAQLRLEQLESRVLLSISPWQAADIPASRSDTPTSYFRASDFDTYTFDSQMFQSLLATAPEEWSEISLPNPAGHLESFDIVESPIKKAKKDRQTGLARKDKKGHERTGDMAG